MVANRKESNQDLFVVKVNAKIQDIISRLSDCIEGDPVVTRREQIKTLFKQLQASRVRLLIAVTGETNVGKSTLINALTGSNLGVDADVKTTKRTEVDYKESIILVDMPGTLSGKLEHDEIATKAIIESDLVLFLISNELFNKSSLPSFTQIIEKYGKQEQILLVVNQCDRVSLRGRAIDEAIAVMTESLREKLLPFPIETAGPVFISARDYLDSLNASNNDEAQQLYEDSRIDTLVTALDQFCKNKGPRGKLARPIQQILGTIEEIRKKLVTCS